MGPIASEMLQYKGSLPLYKISEVNFADKILELNINLKPDIN